MGHGVFIHRADSIYDDSPAEKYQFPRQYRGRAEAWVGDWIVYHEPRKVAETRGYLAIFCNGTVTTASNGKSDHACIGSRSSRCARSRIVSARVPRHRLSPSPDPRH
jgi:hypothetical protein